MIRILLAVLAVIAVPFVIYFLYDLARRGPDGTGVRNPKDWEGFNPPEATPERSLVED